MFFTFLDIKYQIPEAVQIIIHTRIHQYFKHPADSSIILLETLIGILLVQIICTFSI